MDVPTWCLLVACLMPIFWMLVDYWLEVRRRKKLRAIDELNRRHYAEYKKLERERSLREIARRNKPRDEEE